MVLVGKYRGRVGFIQDVPNGPEQGFRGVGLGEEVLAAGDEALAELSLVMKPLDAMILMPGVIFNRARIVAEPSMMGIVISVRTAEI